MWTEEEILDLVDWYIAVEGYDDLRSILSVMRSEFGQAFDSGELDRDLAIRIIRARLREEWNHSKK